MSIDVFATTIALITFFGISAIMALSLNLQYGLAGIPTFGQAFFVSLGAYTAGWTYTRLLPLLAGREVMEPCGAQLGQALQMRSEIIRTLPAIGLTNFVITLLIAALVGGVVGWLASYPALRLKEEWYLALVLLVGGEIAHLVARDYEPLICAHNGLSGIGQPFVWLSPGALSATVFAILVLIAALLTYVYCERLVHSPFGRMLKALREDERAALSLGQPVSRVRGQVMFIGSLLASLAGVLFAVNLGFVSANDYGVALTLDVWVMVVLGGIGNNRGAVLGALIVTLLDRITTITALQLNGLGFQWEFNYVRFILFGLILLLMLRYRPQGLWPESPATTGALGVLGSSNE